MRKIIVTGFAFLALFALISGDVFAGETSKSSTKSASSTAEAAAKTAASSEASSISAKAGCPLSKDASCCARLTAEEHARLCKGDGKCEFTAIEIEGMTCGGCEKSVSAALTDTRGVLKVLRVSYQDGLAEVCYDPTKTDGEALTTAVANKGYQAKIAPAVVTTGDTKVCSKLTGTKKGACCILGKTAGGCKGKKTD